MAELKAVRKRVQDEISGLEWEAEKAYIIATSPRNQLDNSTVTTEEDDFSWEEHHTPYKVMSTGVSTDDKELVVHETNEVLPSVTNGSMPHSVLDVSIPHSKQQDINLTKHNDEELMTDGSISNESIPNTPDKPLAVNILPTNTALQAVQPSSATTTIQSAVHIKPKSPEPRSLSHSSSSTRTHTSLLSLNTPGTNTLIIYGPSGLGRSTLVKKLVYHSPQQFSLVISHTTRAPKPNEMYARDYYFVSHSDMMQKVRQGKFMEYVQIDNSTNTHNYGNSFTPRQSFSSFPATTSTIKATSSEGDLYGTTWDAFQEAQHSGKPWVVLNVSTKGAEQLKDIGVEGHYLLMNSTSSNESDCLVPDHVIMYDKSEEAFGFLENYTLSLTQGYGHKPTSKLESAQDEWERVPSIQLPGKRGAKTKRDSTQKLSQKRITFIELLSHFQSSDLSQQLTLIKPETSHSRLAKVFGPRRTITKKLHDERNLVFAIALCKYDDHNLLHARALSTIYQYLSGTTATCSRFGSHWEDIGFQGSDPTDDLRGVGMLGLLQLVWFLDTPQMTPIALDIFNYSKKGPTPLPFCVISINITCIVLQALREGYISKECNKLEQVFFVCNNLYAAIFVSFYHNWKRHHKGVMELGNILQQVGAFAKKNARFMMRELDKFIQDREKKSSAKFSGILDIVVEPSVEFSNLADM